MGQQPEGELGPPPSDICWLAELEKYSASENRTPRENFLTTALAWVLNTHPAVRHAFLTLVFPDRPFEKPVILTQVTDSLGKRRDLTVRDGKFEAAVECKVDSPPSESQVLQYLSELEKHIRDGSLDACDVAFIGRDRPDFEDERIKERVFSWDQVYQAIPPPKDASQPLVTGFLQYMKENGMVPPKPLRENPDRLAAQLEDMLVRLKQLTDEMVARFFDDWKSQNRAPSLEKTRTEGYPRSIWYYGQRFETDPGNHTIGLFLCWEDSLPLTLALWARPGSKGKWSAYEVMPGLNWQSNWHGWTGLTLSIDVENECADFFSKQFGEQADWLSRRCAEALEPITATL